MSTKKNHHASINNSIVIITSAGNE